MKYKFQTRIFLPFVIFFVGLIQSFLLAILAGGVIKVKGIGHPASILMLIILLLFIFLYFFLIGYLFQWAEYENGIFRFRCMFYVFKEIKKEDIKEIFIRNISEKSPQRTIIDQVIIISNIEVDEKRYKYLMRIKSIYGVIYYTIENYNKLKEIIEG